MHNEGDARVLLQGLTGRALATVTGLQNRVLRLDGDHVIVATSRSPAGDAVPVGWVQAGLDRLCEAGEVEVSVAALGYRSAFIGAVLLTLPGARVIRTSPPRIQLVDLAARYRLEQAGPVNAWWSGDPHERFWLEITDRRDIGVDLHCPQRGTGGRRSAGFSLIWWVRPGDVIFHYSLTRNAIIAWSHAAGPVTEAPTLWRPHRSTTRRLIQEPVPQPGWWLDLDGPFPLAEPVTIAELTGHQEYLRGVLHDLKARHAGSLYFPFFWWRDEQLRPMQYYLNKLPAALVDGFAQLTSALAPPPSPPVPGTPPALGAGYREAQVSPAPSGRQPFSPDPAIVERGLRGHADTQNNLARLLREAGITPRSHQPHEPSFDLAWEADGTVFVAEVKSITSDNEEEQLRLGLGQVLRYRHRLTALGHQRVVAVLVPERSPRDPSWAGLCRELGVALVTGDNLQAAIGLTAPRMPGQ